VTAQLPAQLGHPNKSNFQGQYQGLCIKAKAKDLTFKTKAKDLSLKAKAKDLSLKAKAQDQKCP